jgi:hypothetical protein
MNETKLKQRIENAIDAFFDNGISTESNSLTFGNESGSLRNQISEIFVEKADFLVKILKQVFFFFPSTFVLFIVSFAFTVISINNPINATMPEGRIYWIILWFSAAVFMSWFGLGDLRKSKHFVIPASIIGTGFVVGAISGILSFVFPQLQNMIFGGAYPLYLFPLALVVPFLAKGLADKAKYK